MSSTLTSIFEKSASQIIDELLKKPQKIGVLLSAESKRGETLMHGYYSAFSTALSRKSYHHAEQMTLSEDSSLEQMLDFRKDNPSGLLVLYLPASLKDSHKDIKEASYVIGMEQYVTCN